MVDLNKAMGDAAWAVVKAQASAGEEDPHDRIVRLVHQAGDSLIASIDKDFDESSHQRDEHGKFVGMSARGAENLRQRIANIRATLPAHQHEAAISQEVSRSQARVRAAAAARAAGGLNTPEGRSAANQRAAATRARNQAARQASEAARQAAAARPPEAQVAAEATAPNAPLEAQAAATAAPPAHEPAASVVATGRHPDTATDNSNVHAALQYFNGLEGSGGPSVASPDPAMRQRLANAGLIEGVYGGHRLTEAGRNTIRATGDSEADTGAIVRQRELALSRGEQPTGLTPGPHPAVASMNADVEREANRRIRARLDAIPARNQDSAVDARNLHDALSYFRGLENSTRTVDMSAVSPDMRQRLVNAGLLERRPGGASGHQLTTAGRNLFDTNQYSTQDVGGAVAVRERSIASGETPAPPPAPAQQESYYDRRDRERREEAERRAREPGGSPTNPIVVEKGAPRGPGVAGATCAAATWGKPDGTYVLRERSGDHKVTQVAPIKLNMIDTPENARHIFGPKMPDNATFEKVWGHEAGGVTCQITSNEAYGKTASFLGNIVKKDPNGGTRVIGQFTRRFKKMDDGKLVADHAYFKIEHTDDQGGGAGATMLGQAFHAYKEMGVDHIVVHPEWVGPYAWASFGYDNPTRKDYGESQMPQLKANLSTFLQKHGIPEARAKEVADQCNRLSHFADLDLTPDGRDASKGNPGLAIHHVSQESDRNGVNSEYDLHLGAKFLLTPMSEGGGKWSEATLNLQNPRSSSYERAKARLGVK